jgi:hypothetical protein
MQAALLLAQSEENPYSRFGLGTIVSPAFSANKGMGYLSAPYVSAININAANPASYAFLTRTTAEIGVNIDGVNIVANDSAHSGARGGLSHFALAFVPPTKHDDQRWAITVALLPYSYVNYNFVQNFNDSIHGIGPYSQSFVGTGQLYQLFVGGAYKYKGFSIGANVGYIFGKLQYEKSNDFPDSINAMNTENYVNMNAKGLMYNVGIIYQVRLYHNREDPDVRRDIYAYFGAYGSGGSNLTTTVSEYWNRNYLNSTDSTLTVADTLQSIYNQKGKIKVPYNFGAGAMFGNERFWMIGADFKYQNWTNYTTPLDNGGLVNSWQVSVGAQIIPKVDDRAYLNNVQYRLGAYYGKSDIVINGTNLSQGGATLSFGFPLIRNTAHINFTGDFGSIGAPDKSIIRANYYRFSLGFVLNDAWFIKRKFD